MHKLDPFLKLRQNTLDFETSSCFAGAELFSDLPRDTMKLDILKFEEVLKLKFVPYSCATLITDVLFDFCFCSLFSFSLISSFYSKLTFTYVYVDNSPS